MDIVNMKFWEMLFKALSQINFGSFFNFRVTSSSNIECFLFLNVILYSITNCTTFSCFHFKLKYLTWITSFWLFFTFCDFIKQVHKILHCILLLTGLEFWMPFSDQCFENLWFNSFLKIGIRNWLILVFFTYIFVGKLFLRIFSTKKTVSKFLNLALETLGWELFASQ